MENLIFECSLNRKIHCITEVDDTKKVIHVVDFYSPTALVHCFPEVQKKIVHALTLKGTPLGWQWILYTRDGEIYTYDTKRFTKNGSGFYYLGCDENTPGTNEEMCALMMGLKRLNYY